MQLATMVLSKKSKEWLISFGVKTGFIAEQIVRFLHEISRLQLERAIKSDL